MNSDPLEKLLSIGGDALSMVEPVPALMGDDSRTLGGLLRRKNGFYAFESALHVFASGDITASGRSLEEWNDSRLWKHFYGDLMSEGLFFAEDVFGGQFVLAGDVVHTFNPETAELVSFAESVEAWAAKVLDRYDHATGYSIAHAWQMENGALPAGHRLIPRVPFVVGGEYEADNIVPVEASVAMRYWAGFAKVISELPDGANLRFNPQAVESVICAKWDSKNGSSCLCFNN